ncbi:MAG: hypothetical protein LH615_16045 [Ferruginibacter sp.]|nr:hypothetical protein [Ferruginibacter sp.]
MKHIITALFIFCFNANPVKAQEGVQDLSKKAKSGFITDTDNSSGNYLVTYKMEGDKRC